MNIPDALGVARVVLGDTEYVDREDGNPVIPVCMVAKELRSGQVWRVAIGGFGTRAPFPTDKQTLFVSYSVPAEMSVFAALRWPYPARVLDLFAEHRNNINGLSASNLNFPGDRKDLWKQRGAAMLHGIDPTPDRIKKGPHSAITSWPTLSPPVKWT